MGDFSDEDYLKETLVDAEMVIDTFEGKEIPRLLIYDLIYFNVRNFLNILGKRFLGCFFFVFLVV